MIGDLKERTLGNSATRLRATLVEQHSEQWMTRSLLYFSLLDKLRVPAAPQHKVPPMHPVPTVHWLLSVFVREALTRLDVTKARVTSIFGTILKMASNKKASLDYIGSLVNEMLLMTISTCYDLVSFIYSLMLSHFQMTTKLAGSAAGTAACVTNVGNEHGQVCIASP